MRRLSGESRQSIQIQKSVLCGYAIRTVRGVVDIARGNTANVCSIDISKAVDRLNHYVLLAKLMKRLLLV